MDNPRKMLAQEARPGVMLPPDWRELPKNYNLYSLQAAVSALSATKCKEFESVESLKSLIEKELVFAYLIDGTWFVPYDVIAHFVLMSGMGYTIKF